MSVEQPQAHNYVASQDFSANASTGGQRGAAIPGGCTAPPQFVPQKQDIAANNEFRPPQQQQHLYPPPNSGQQWQQNPQQQQWGSPPPVNQQSHPYPPNPNLQSKPYPVAQHPSGTVPEIGFPPGQQYGQMSFDEKFRPVDNKPKWNDVWATILFLAVFIALCVVGGFSINAYRQTYSFQGSGVYDNTNTFTLDSNALILFAFILVMGFVLSFGYFGLAAIFPKQFIWLTGILHCILGFGSAIVYFIFHYYSAAIVFLIFAIFYVVCFLSWRHRIPFSAQIFRFTMRIMSKYPSTLTVSALGLVMTLAFGAFWTLTLVGAYVKYHPNGNGQNNPACNTPGGSCSSAALIIVLVFIICSLPAGILIVAFAGFYTSEIIKNVIHTTISGIFGSYYYGFNTPSGVPRHAAWGSFRRSMTYSFGSISFGSLVVSIISFIRQISAVGKVAAAQEGDSCMYLIFCCFNCIAQIIEGLVRWFNHYAYTQIALYGKKYLHAASDTWRIFKDRGIDAIINDLLIDNVLVMGSILVAYATALLAYLWLRYTNPAYNSSGGFFVPIVAFGFLIGLQMTNIAVVPIKSGVATLFVAMAEDPEALHENFPDLYQAIVQTYPQLRFGVLRGEV